MKTIKCLMSAMALGLVSICVNAQITLEEPKLQTFSCPKVKPLAAKDIAVEDYYEHYLKYVKYLGRVARGKIATKDAIEIAKELREQYKELDYISRNMSDLIVFNDLVLQSFSSYDGFNGLNTQLAEDIARLQRAETLIRLFQNSTLCVSPSQSRKNQFELHFYGVKRSQCKRMLKNTKTYAAGILVNGSSGNQCVDDHTSVALRGWTLWSDLGRNHVTLVFQRW